MATFQNPYQQMRLRNIMAPQSTGPTFKRPGFIGNTGATDMMHRTQSPMDESSAYFDEIMRVRQSAGPGLSAYRQALSQAPTREEHKPGWLTRIAAGLSGASAGFRDPGEGISVAQGLNASGYENAMRDYGTRLGTLKESADIEQAEAEATIKAIAQARAMGLKYDEFKLKQAEADRKAQIDAQNAGSTRMTAEATMARARAYAESIGKKNYEPTLTETGILYVNKNDPNDSFEVDAKTIAAGNLGVSRRNAATGEGNLRNNVRRTNIYGESQDNAHRRGMMSLAIDAGREQRLSANGGANRPLTPGAQADAQKLALSKLFMDPEWRKFVTTDGQGNYDPVDPEDLDDEELEEYQLFLEELADRMAIIGKGGR